MNDEITVSSEEVSYRIPEISLQVEWPSHAPKESANGYLFAGHLLMSSEGKLIGRSGCEAHAHRLPRKLLNPLLRFRSAANRVSGEIHKRCWPIAEDD